MKYLFITLLVQDGENRHTHRVLTTCKDKQNVLQAADKYAKTYYGKAEKDSNDDWWFFNCGTIAVKVQNVEVLSEYEYKLMSKIFSGEARPGYFQIEAAGYNEGLEREEIQVHCGENGNLMITKTPEGFVVDIYNQDENIDSMTVWEDDLSPVEITIDPEIQSKAIEMFLLNKGQKHSEITANLSLRPSHADSDEILMEDYFYLEGKKQWYPKSGNSMYTQFEAAIALYLQENRDNY
jgi:hypothetical protein